MSAKGHVSTVNSFFTSLCIFKDTGVCIIKDTGTHIFIQVPASLKMPFCTCKFFHSVFLLLPPKATVFQCDTSLGSFAVGILMSILFQLATYHFLFNFLYIIIFSSLFSHMLQECFPERMLPWYLLACVCFYSLWIMLYILFSPNCWRFRRMTQWNW